MVAARAMHSDRRMRETSGGWGEDESGEKLLVFFVVFLCARARGRADDARASATMAKESLVRMNISYVKI